MIRSGFRATIKPKKKERMNLREPSVIECQGHRQWIRGRACALASLPGHQCSGPIECMHVRSGTDGGGAQKPSDFWCFPGCKFGCHLPQTVEGEPAFERLHKISMKALARQYAAQSPHKHKWLDLGRDPAKEGTDIAPRVYSTVERKRSDIQGGYDTNPNETRGAPIYGPTDTGG